jgi:hypothetical protein
VRGSEDRCTKLSAAKRRLRAHVIETSLRPASGSAPCSRYAPAQWSGTRVRVGWHKRNVDSRSVVQARSVQHNWPELAVFVNRRKWPAPLYGRYRFRADRTKTRSNKLESGSTKKTTSSGMRGVVKRRVLSHAHCCYTQRVVTCTLLLHAACCHMQSVVTC